MAGSTMSFAKVAVSLFAHNNQSHVVENPLGYNVGPPSYKLGYKPQKL
jgi:hypothetical protein